MLGCLSSAQGGRQLDRVGTSVQTAVHRPMAPQPGGLCGLQLSPARPKEPGVPGARRNRLALGRALWDGWCCPGVPIECVSCGVLPAVLPMQDVGRRRWCPPFLVELCGASRRRPALAVALLRSKWEPPPHPQSHSVAPSGEAERACGLLPPGPGPARTRAVPVGWAVQGTEAERAVT